MNVKWLSFIFSKDIKAKSIASLRPFPTGDAIQLKRAAKQNNEKFPIHEILFFDGKQ